MEDLILYVVLLALMGYWCSRIAEKNGRSVGLAWFMGILFGIVSVGIYYLMGKSQAVKDAELDAKVEAKIRTIK